MTDEIMRMTEEELINNIAEADKLGKELEAMTKDMIDARMKLLEQAEELYLEIKNGTEQMASLALVQAEMRLVLQKKYGKFVM